MAKSRHALCSTSRGAEAKYQRSGMGQPATDFWMEVGEAIGDLGIPRGHTLAIALCLGRDYRQSEHL
jgi:hypothetical protein